MRSCGFKSHLPHEKERPQIIIWGLFFFRTEADLDPWSKVSASLRSVQNRGPPDLVHPIFRVFPNSSSASPRSPRHDHASSVGSEEKRFPEPFFLSSSPHLPPVCFSYSGYTWVTLFKLLNIKYFYRGL